MLCAMADTRAVSTTRSVRSTKRLRPSAKQPPCPAPISATHRYGAAIGASSTPVTPAPISAVPPTAYPTWWVARLARDGTTSDTGICTSPENDSRNPATAGVAPKSRYIDGSQPSTA